MKLLSDGSPGTRTQITNGKSGVNLAVGTGEATSAAGHLAVGTASSELCSRLLEAVKPGSSSSILVPGSAR